MTHADECRALGLKVGDTIIGREDWGKRGWEDAELTLLWLGKEEVVWSCRRRFADKPEWSEPHEAVSWTLDRDWKKVKKGAAP